MQHRVQPLRLMPGHAVAQAEEPKVEIPRRHCLVHARHGVEVIRGRPRGSPPSSRRSAARGLPLRPSAPSCGPARGRAVDRRAGHHTGVWRGKHKRDVPVAQPPGDEPWRPIRVLPSDDHADSVMIAIQDQPVVGPGLHRLPPHPRCTSAHAVAVHRAAPRPPFASGVPQGATGRPLRVKGEGPTRPGSPKLWPRSRSR
jgi:hypothetical protein